MHRRSVRSALSAAAIAATLGLLASAATSDTPDASSFAFERNLSSTAELPTTQAKLEALQFYVPAKRADGQPATVEYRDSSGDVVEQRDVAKPLVAIYQDQQPDAGGGADVFAGYSLDDGDSWARTNLSMSAARSSFTLENATPYPGGISKPAITQKGNRVLVAWTSTYCDDGSPRYEAEPEADRWGVAGEQNSTDYAQLGFPAVGELPNKCLWTARGVVDTKTGAVVWRQPERLTSGSRHAMQIALNSAPNAGFAIAWAEDPEGVRPGQGSGPGPGWSGANPNDGTDVWFSYIPMSDFDAVQPGGDPAAPVVHKRMSMPAPISDNAPRAAQDVPDGEAARLCADTYEQWCVTDDERLLNGDRGATRPSLMLSPYTYTGPDGTTASSAWVALGYEETKGLGDGDGDGDGEGDGEGGAALGAAGKNVVHHAFDLRSPDVVAGGTLLNPQMTGASGQPLFVEKDGNPLLDWKGDPVPARENARRLRYLVQPKAQIGASRTIAVALYRMGVQPHAGAADVVMQRFVVPHGDAATDNPLRPGNLAPGIANISSVTPLAQWTDPQTGARRVTRWRQTAQNLDDGTSAFADDDGRAHRGFIKGDFLALGYEWTPHWEEFLAGRDVENYYVRRSFDGGGTFTTTPAELGGSGRTSCLYFYDPADGRLGEPDCEQLDAGEFEPAQNLSRLDGYERTVIEPRLVGLPGTISGSPYPEDVQDTSVLWQAWGTSEPQGGDLEEDDVEVLLDEDAGPTPIDLHYTFSQDHGDEYAANAQIADGPAAQAGAQLRPTADGSKMSVVWNEYGPGDLDAYFRRIAPAAFPYNTGPGKINLRAPVIEVREGEDADVEVERLLGSRGAVSATITTDAATAGAGTDFTPVDTSVPFDHGQRRATVTVKTIDDAVAEPVEVLHLRLDDPQGGALLGATIITELRIVDDDQPAAPPPPSEQQPLAPSAGRPAPPGTANARPGAPRITALRITPKRFRSRPRARIAIRFTLSAPARTVINIRRNGQIVRTLRTRFRSQGPVTVRWDARSLTGRAVTPGLYSIAVQAFAPNGDPGARTQTFVRALHRR
ncbi:MAG: choice-of-anchor O protein [Thermoleophilia bacterium]